MSGRDILTQVLIRGYFSDDSLPQVFNLGEHSRTAVRGCTWHPLSFLSFLSFSDIHKNVHAGQGLIGRVTMDLRHAPGVLSFLLLYAVIQLKSASLLGEVVARG